MATVVAVRRLGRARVSPLVAALIVIIPSIITARRTRGIRGLGNAACVLFEPDPAVGASLVVRGTTVTAKAMRKTSVTLVPGDGPFELSGRTAVGNDRRGSGEEDGKNGEETHFG